MADITIKILTPALCFDLLTLEELKLGLGIGGVEMSEDAALNQLIDQNSNAVSVQCNRVFARERVRETWRDLENRRLYLSHWPVVEDDIETVEAAGSMLDPGMYELEERSGKLSLFGARDEPVVVTYTGGFNLPHESPDALKQAATLLIRTARTQAAREATTGIRSIMHKESRVMFFDPNAARSGTTTTSTSGGADAVKSLLYHFTRIEC